MLPHSWQKENGQYWKEWIAVEVWINDKVKKLNQESARNEMF